MLEVIGLEKSYEGAPLLRGVSFRFEGQEILCLLGPSGSGKSTLLRILAGLEEPEAGRVLWQGADITGVPPHLRGFGLMFQDYALFPHRSVAENVAFGLRMQNLPGEEIERRVEEALARVNLQGFGGRGVADLSGGEQQRVALARALAPRPRLLMLDEPLGALDRGLRERLLEDLRRILRQERIPALYVTHDQEEAYAIADRLLILHDGTLIQQGRPSEVYASPASEWVAEFLGLKNLLHGRVLGLDPYRVSTPIGILVSACDPEGRHLGEMITVLLRPIGIHLAPEESGTNRIEGVIEDVVFRGEGYRLGARIGAETLLTFFADRPAALGARVVLTVEPEAVQCL